jgi:hypothetical protein
MRFHWLKKVIGEQITLEELIRVKGYKKHGIVKYDKITYAKDQDTDS